WTELMWTGTLAHNTLLQTGRVGDWASHRLGRDLSALYGMAHGATLAIVFPAWMKYVLPGGAEKLKQFSVAALDVPGDLGDDRVIALEGIRRLEAFLKTIGMPTRLRDAGIDGSRLEEMAGRATSGGPQGAYVPIDKSAAMEIYKLAQ
ncbi:MAG: iron-containing alcohol dehydrogenase, partial [Clostridia bacterium]|nr:iron-containing alcohol dehydrogenase [Clostridia bacterium]